MPPYIPTDNPQFTGKMNTTSLYALKHQSQFKTLGPLLPNFYVARQSFKLHDETKMLYADHSVNESVTIRKQGACKNHPYSLAAKKPCQAVNLL
jgi:hypothetical protein